MTLLDYLPTVSIDVPSSDVAADLAAVVPRKITNPDGSPLKWHWSGLRVRFGKEACYAFQAALIQHDPMANDLLSGTGIDFAEDTAQQSIDDLVSAGAFSQEIGDDLKSLGVELATKWERVGGDGMPPSAEDIDAAREQIATQAAADAAEAERIQAIANLLAMLANEIGNPAISSEATLADVKAAIVVACGE